MKAVWYYEVTRRRDNFIRMIVTPIVLLAMVFVLSLVVDAVFPVVNRVYMKWPDMITELLSFPVWNSKLYVNLWQLFAIIYPIVSLYNIMTGVANSIIEEERLETVVYLRNLSVKREYLMLGKLIVWCVAMGIGLFFLAAENGIFFLLVGAENMLGMMIKHYLSLFLVGIIGISFAVFLASYHKTEASCEDSIMTMMILTFITARMYTLIRFLSDLFVATGREGVVTERMDGIAERLRILTVVSPVTWCWPGVSVRGIYIVCGIAITVILLVAALYIYPQRMFKEVE